MLNVEKHALKKIQHLFRKSSQLVTPYLPNRQAIHARKRWESQWATLDFPPHWRTQEIPEILQEALDQQWFTPGSNLLDIGCGSGECANWLAQQGFSVLGIDFAPSAIRRAQATYPEHEGLHFRVLDICQNVPTQTFNTLFDRGCFHIIPSSQRPQYVQQVARAAKPNAHFLLLHRIWGTREKSLPLDELANRSQPIVSQIQRDFTRLFEIICTQPISYPDRKPDVAVWMVRR
jgi:2-polyprenyl-3-methyl-5-hydroxy-6-metoxy-1,4-benzoquinol methylase